MRGVKLSGFLALCAALALPGSVSAQSQRKMPYWASINAGKARMRAGPGRQYPVRWLYVRADLPIKVVASIPSWRKVEDPDGTQGWMQATLLSERRTAIIVGAVGDLLSQPETGAHVSWRAEPGVVGRISRCARGWCYFDVRGRGGFVEQARLWGLDPNEAIP